jgi:RHS repeat-associated protein
VGKLAWLGMGAMKGTKVAMAFSGTLGKTLGGIRSGLSNLRTSALALGKRVLGREPVDLATGEMVLWQTDVDLPGVLGLSIGRTHLSSYRTGRWFGPSWASTLDQRLEVDAEGVCFAADDGTLLVYPPPGTGHEVLPAEGPRWPLRRTADGYEVSDTGRGRTLHFAAVSGWWPADPANAAVEILPLVAISDRNENRITLHYTDGGILHEVSHTGGYRIGVEVADGHIAALHADGAELVRYGYDADGRLVEVVNSSGQPLRFEYDQDGRIVGWRDRNGTEYGYGYDIDGRCVTTSGSDGYMDGTISFDTERRVTVMTDSLGHATEYHLNDNWQVVRVVDPLGNETLREWDRYDRLVAETDPLGRTTRYEYDPAGNVIAVIRPDGARAVSAYNELRLPVVLTGFDGATWLREYDERGNLTAVTDPAGAVTTYRYDERGRLVGVTDAAGQAKRIEPDAAGLPIAVADATGATTGYTRDGSGRIVAVTDPLGNSTTMGYTVEGKVAWRRAPDGATETFEYDAEGNLVTHVDAIGQVRRFEVGHFDLTSARTAPDGNRVEFGYDTELRLRRVVNGLGQAWQYEYDPAGRLVAETDFNGRGMRYTHDAAGQLSSRTNGAGETTHFGYDAAGRLVERRTPDGTTRFAYDPAGRLIRATGPDADLVIERDPVGRVLAETSDGRTVTSRYDTLGRRIYRRTPSGAESTWEYDAGSRPVALHAGGQTVRFGYDPAGREIERTFAGGLALTQSWDAGHRLTSQRLRTGDARDIAGREYTYRPDGLLAAVEDQVAGVRRYELDPAGRITAVDAAGWSERYAYDAAGNLTRAEWPSGGEFAADLAGDREFDGTLLRRAGRTRYEHDAQGRVVLRQQKQTSTKPWTWRYEWDANDRLVAATVPDGTRWRYRYDPLGRRVAKQRLDAGGGVVAQVDFVWDGSVPVEQVTADRVTVWDYEPGGFRPVAQRSRLASATQDEIDELFYGIVTDLTGQPTELVGADGSLAWQARNTIWGAPGDDGAPVRAGDGAQLCPLRLPGQYHDAETGLHYNYHRYYEPETARYQSNDPLGLAPAPNPHGYVPNPVQQMDPIGLAPYVTVYRWGDRANPHELLPKLASAPQHVQDDVARMLEDPAWRMWRAESHAAGDTLNTPFISVAADPMKALNTTDPWLHSITRSTPDIAVLRVPESSLIAPQNPLSLSESELLFQGNDLSKYVVNWVPNPWKI